MAEPPAPRVVVTVGTDHHPFQLALVITGFLGLSGDPDPASAIFARLDRNPGEIV